MDPDPVPVAGVVAWRERILDGLTALGLTFTADAMQHAEVEANGAELQIRLPSEFKLMTKVEDLQKAIQNQQLGSIRIKLSFGDVQAVARVLPPAVQDASDVTAAALAHPEVQRFRDIFGGEVRAVRDLKE